MNTPTARGGEAQSRRVVAVWSRTADSLSLRQRERDREAELSVVRPRDGRAGDAVRLVRQAARRGRSCWLKPSHVAAIVAGRAPDGWYTRGSDALWWRLGNAARGGVGCRISADDARELVDVEGAP